MALIHPQFADRAADPRAGADDVDTFDGGENRLAVNDLLLGHPIGPARLGERGCRQGQGGKGQRENESGQSHLGPQTACGSKIVPVAGSMAMVASPACFHDISPPRTCVVMGTPAASQRATASAERLPEPQ